MRSRSGYGGVVLGLSLAMGACGDGGESARGARFELVATQAGELPAVLGERGGCRFEAVGGSVELGTDSLYSAQLRRRRLCLPSALGDSIPTSDTTFVDPGEGRYTVEGDSVFFRFESGASAGFGVIRGDTLVVQGPGQILYYRRVGR